MGVVKSTGVPERAFSIATVSKDFFAVGCLKAVTKTT
jgi:hypothetical protein